MCSCVCSCGVSCVRGIKFCVCVMCSGCNVCLWCEHHALWWTMLFMSRVRVCPLSWPKSPSCPQEKQPPPSLPSCPSCRPRVQAVRSMKLLVFVHACVCMLICVCVCVCIREKCPTAFPLEFILFRLFVCFHRGAHPRLAPSASDSCCGGRAGSAADRL